MTLFIKLALAVSTLLVGTTVCLSLSFYVMERRSIRAEADQERQAILQHLTHIARESHLLDDDLLLAKYIPWLQTWNSSLVSASVVTPDGHVLAHTEPRLIGQVSVLATDGREVRDRALLNQPVYLGGRWIATVSASFSERQFQESIRERLHLLQHRLVLISAGALGAGLALSLGLANSWTRPIRSLAHAAHEVGQGHFTLDLSATSRRRDELGFLSNCFRTMAQELQGLEQRKDDFVSAVTHELRSPLGAIESYLNLVREEIREGAPLAGWEAYIERMQVNTRRLTQFINDLLDVAALERGNVTLQRQPVNLAGVIQDVVGLYAAKLAEKGVVCEIGLPPPPIPPVGADPDKIRHVLMNLLSNAIKFTPAKGKIEVRLMVTGPVLRVLVKDTGIGIAPEDQAKIFSKFEQVVTARQTVQGPKGTGLGLSISRALVQLHGGELAVDSLPGKGSCFHFTLPLVSSETSPRAERSRKGTFV